MRIGRYVFTGCQVIERRPAERARAVSGHRRIRTGERLYNRPGDQHGGANAGAARAVALSGFPIAPTRWSGGKPGMANQPHTERHRPGRAYPRHRQLTADVAAKIRPVKTEARTRR